jgi:membrane protein required for colicin V production
MTLLDWTMLAVITLSVALAAAQGFFFEVFSLSGTILGYLLAMWEYPRLAAWFLPYVKGQQYANIAGFLTIFFSIIILAGMVARIARWAAKEIGLRWVDRLLGGAFGLVRGIVIVTVAVMAFAAFSPNSPALARSQLSGYFLLAARTGTWVAPSELRAKVRDGASAIRNMNPELASQHDRKPSAGEPAEPSSQNDQKKSALSEPELRADSNRKTSEPHSSPRVSK